ncbi:UNVERIFIED_CONTAM: hypothetical protein Sradi_3012400 [Sesamum radiatum]|uniref:Retrotransposon Copia-like N-terminal domain-containing protein n=1 Tax=Sesamum radiatum TaxID=300843 RepID=A0AAW2S112_SESRA
MASEIAENTDAGNNNMPQQCGSEVLQLHSSDHPGMILVSTPLDGNNFLAWSRGVRRALEAKSKLGFITGTCKRPIGDPELIEQWTRADSMVVTWLLNAMNKNIANAFIYIKSARVLWITLTERYSVCNGPLLYQLEHEISSATQGDLSIMDYFTKLQMLWDELVQLRPLPECTCGCPCTCNLAKATTDLIEERHLMQFLMGLNDEYDSFIGHQYKKKGLMDKKALRCDSCGRQGHDRSTCFKIHGVPDWYKELNNQRRKVPGDTNKAYAVNNTDVMNHREGLKEDKPSVSEVVMEVMKALKRIPNDPIQANCAENYAGLHYSFSGIGYLDKTSWIIDSGATIHMCSDLHAFTLLQKSSTVSSIFLPNGTKTQVTQSGPINLSPNLVLKDTLMFLVSRPTYFLLAKFVLHLTYALSLYLHTV